MLSEIRNRLIYAVYVRFAAVLFCVYPPGPRALIALQRPFYSILWHRTIIIFRNLHRNHGGIDARPKIVAEVRNSMSTRKREVPGPLRRKSAVIWNYPATNTLSAVFGPSNIRVELVRIAV